MNRRKRVRKTGQFKVLRIGGEEKEKENKKKEHEMCIRDRFRRRCVYMCQPKQ